MSTAVADLARQCYPQEVDPKAHRHFAAVGKAFEQDAARRQEEARKLTPLQRMAIGYELGRSAIYDETERALDARARGQAELQRKARRLRAGRP